MFSYLKNGFIQAFGMDYRSLAILRIGLAILFMSDLIMRLRDFTAFFTDAGIFPRNSIIHWYQAASSSLYFINGSGTWAVLLVVISFVSAIAMALGFKTKWATIASFIMLYSLQFRTPAFNSSGDDLLKCLFFWAMFLPLGAKFSLDAKLASSNLKEKSHFSLATFCILNQAMLVYWIGAVLKSGDAWTKNFTAIEWAMSLGHFTTPLGKYFLENFQPVMKSMTQAVWMVELYGPILMFMPFALLYFRLPTQIFLIGMHASFIFLINIGFFPYLSILSILLFTQPKVWDFICKLRIATQIQISLKNIYTKFRPHIRRVDLAFEKARPRIHIKALSQLPLTILLVAFVLVVYKNGHRISSSTFPKNKVMDHSLWILGLSQNWGMFAPFPLKTTRWTKFEATLEDGQTYDLVREKYETAPKYMPIDILSDYSNYRWRKYFDQLPRKNYGYLRKHLVTFYCREWKKKNPDNPIISITMKMGKRMNPVNNTQIKTGEINMGNYFCSSKRKPVKEEMPKS